ncbi:hypothetical protein GCM10018952_62840 [Streptosporangium vulgare]
MIDLVRSHRLVAIIRKPDEDEARAAAATEVLAAGVRLIEVTMTTPGALGLIRELAGTWPDAVVGAGTVLTPRGRRRRRSRPVPASSSRPTSTAPSSRPRTPAGPPPCPGPSPPPRR